MSSDAHALLLAAGGLAALLAPLPVQAPSEIPEPAFERILEEDVQRHLVAIASPELEGRDSPSPGLERAGDYVIERLREAGFRGAGAAGSFRIPFTMRGYLPDEAKSSLVVERGEDGSRETLALGEDFVPLVHCTGEAEGEAVFVGFGISARKEHWDDTKGVEVRNRVAVMLEGEPRHKRLFDGPEITDFSDVHAKVEDLKKEGALGVLVVRRPPPDEAPGAGGKRRGTSARSGPSIEGEAGAAEPLPPPVLGFRGTFAHWNPTTTKPLPAGRRRFDLPVLEITADAAERILGADVEALAREMEGAGKPRRLDVEGVVVRLASGLREGDVPVDNVVGILEGTDPELADEYVVIGAHLDHVGVDPLGRIGCGADDNASGTVAMLEIADALGAARPRRSILACAFAAEEKGLVGSQELCRAPPVPKDAMVAMLNMDMVGRGKVDEVVVLGAKDNADLAEALDRARRMRTSKVKSVVTDKAEHLWERSDHFSFHEIGVPVLFFFEGPSESDNPDYHTYRDTIDLVSIEKVTRTARLVYQTTWLIANDDDRPSRRR